MAYGHDSFNQHDFQSQSGKEIYGVVVDIDDPEKRGRVKCLCFEQHGQNGQTAVKDDDLPWLKVVGSPYGGAQNRGVGVFPHMLQCGSKVTLRFDGQQNLVVVGVHQNDSTDETVQDQPKTTTPTLMQVVNALTQPGSKNPVLKQMFGGKMPYEFKGIQQALAFLNGTYKTPQSPYEGDPLEAILKFAPKPSPLTGRGSDSYWDRDGRTPFTLGPYKPEIDKKIIKKIQDDLGTKGELIPGALAMAEKLVTTAKSGINIDTFTMRGGESVVTAAIAAVSTLLTLFNNTAKHKEDENNAIEEVLRAIYKAETGKEPLDDQGRETYDYKQWKIARLKAAGIETGALS